MAFMIAMPNMLIAEQPTVNLGSTSEFAILAGSTITNTGTTTIGGSVGGDVGLHPGNAFTGQASVTTSGAVYLADDTALQAKNDLIIAYDDAAGRADASIIPAELGGTILLPGVYDSADGTFQITGTLTLDAQGNPDGVFIFRTDFTLITASASNVKLINSARFCRTFWKVGSSATLGTNSHFTGHIFAMESITATTGATVQGQLLARNGAVTLDSNVITNGFCETTPTTPEEEVTPPVVETPTTPEERDERDERDEEATPPVAETPTTPEEEVTPPVVETPTTPEEEVTPPVVETPTTPEEEVTPPVAETPTTPKEEVTPPIVVKPIVPPTTTIPGGQLPKTSTNLYQLLLLGAALMLVGAVSLRSRKRYE